MARSKRRRRQMPTHRTPAAATSSEQSRLPLAELRRRLDLTQVEIAARLAVSQRAVSHVEHEPNPRVATIGAYVRALGGRLELRAVFADHCVELRLAGPRAAPADGMGPAAP